MNAVIRMRGAVGAQFRLLFDCGRVYWLLVLPALVASSALLGYVNERDLPIFAGELLMMTQGLGNLVALAWGVAVWSGEPPQRRDHLLALPADVTDHEASRVLAGVLWLTVALAMTLTVAIAASALTGAAGQLGEAPWRAWTALFSGPLLAYTLASVATTGSRNGARMVVLGMVALYIVSVIVVYTLFATGPADAVQTYRDLNLGTALFGIGVESSQMNGYDVHYSAPGEPARPITEFEMVMSPAWDVATILWWTFAVAALLLVLLRRRRA